MINVFCIRPKGFNIGNDAIFLGLRHLLQEAFGRVVNLISLPATSRYESHAKAGLTSQTIHEINQYGHGVIVGGGNIYENGELEVNPDALPTLEPPLMLFSLSSGRIYNRERRLVPRTDSMPAPVVKALHNRALISVARDEATLKYLHGLGCEQSILGGCPTLFLSEQSDRLPVVSTDDRGGALVSIRTPSLMNLPLDIKARIPAEIGRIVKELRDRDYENVRLLCHDHRDIPFAASFTDMDYVYTGDVYSYLSLLRSASVCVSYRLHSVLPGISFGTPCISLSYDERSSSLLQTACLGDWDINIVHSPNVAGEVADRLARLEELDEIRNQALDRWKGFRTVMAESVQRFARETLRYRDSYAAVEANPR